MATNKIKIFLLLTASVIFLPKLILADYDCKTSSNIVGCNIFVTDINGNSTEGHDQSTFTLKFPRASGIPTDSILFDSCRYQDSRYHDDYSGTANAVIFWRACMNTNIQTGIDAISSTCIGGDFNNTAAAIQAVGGGMFFLQATIGANNLYYGLCPALKDSGINLKITQVDNQLKNTDNAVTGVGNGDVPILRIPGTPFNYKIDWTCPNPNNSATWTVSINGSNDDSLKPNTNSSPLYKTGLKTFAAVNNNQDSTIKYTLTCAGMDHPNSVIDKINTSSTYGQSLNYSDLINTSGNLSHSIIDNYAAADYRLNPANLKSGTLSKSVLIFLGNIPNPPTINSFDFVTPDPNLEVNPTDATSARVQVGKPFKLKWDVANVQEASATSSVTIYKRVGGTKTPLISTNTASGSQEIKPDKTGVYNISIEVINPKYPELTPTPVTRSLRLTVYDVSVPQMVNVQFSATKTSITSGDSSTLTWNAVDAKTVNINPNIGKVSSQGTLDVSPIVTTTYNLTAASIFTDVGTTTKSITIKVNNAATTLPEDIKNEAGCLAAGYYWYDNSCHGNPKIIVPAPPDFGPVATSGPQTIDLKINGSDGPVTLKAPANFKLSWNLNTYCLATGDWLDVKFKAGTQDISIKKNGKYTYSLYCPGYGSDSVEVNVVGGTGANANTGLLDSLSGNNTDKLSNEPMPVVEAAVSTDQSTYSQNINVIKGQPTSIYIKVDQDVTGDGLASRDETGQWSDLLADGGRCLYNTKLVKGTPQFDGMIESPVNPQACNARLGNFTFNNEPGTYQYGILKLMQNNNKFSNIAYVNITVENPPPQTGAPVIDLRINDNDNAEQILGTPANYNLTWNVTNANICEASGSWNGTKSFQGIQNFVSSEAKDFTYTLTCVGQLGTTAKAIALKVAESPVCQFTALPPTINKQSAFVTESELSWKCDYADECSIQPNISASIKTYGSVRVSPAQTTTYDLTCVNSAVSKKFEATVEVQ